MNAELSIKLSKVLGCGYIKQVPAPSVGLLVGAGTPVYQFFPDPGVCFGLAQQTDDLIVFIDLVYYTLIDENIINPK